MTNGQAIVPAIVIDGTIEYWPGGPQTFRSLPARREPDDDAFWFSSELMPRRQLGGVQDHLRKYPADAERTRPRGAAGA